MIIAADLDAREEPEIEFSKGYPISTFITPELIAHCSALEHLLAAEAPLLVPVRPTDAHKLRYVVGDASAEGFFIATQYPDLSITTRGGLWEDEFAEGSSNLREAQNFGNHLLDEIKAGKHDGCAVWA